MCWDEMIKRNKKERANLKWEEGERRFFEDRGLEMGEVEAESMGKEEVSSRLIKVGRQKNREQRWKRIRKLSFNK